MHSVFGTAKATQEADNVLILQHEMPPQQAYIPPHMQAQMAQQQELERLNAGDEGEDGEEGDVLGGKRRLSLEVHKNRFDGTLGRIPLEFDDVRASYKERIAVPPKAAQGQQKLTMPNKQRAAVAAPVQVPRAPAQPQQRAPEAAATFAEDGDEAKGDTVDIIIG